MYIPSSADEASYLKKYDPDKYKKPSVSVDTAVFTHDMSGLYVLLIRRGGYPYRGRLAVPGGFLNMNEALEAAAKRELMEETGLSCDIAQCYTLGEPGRDPRDRVITVLFGAFADKGEVCAGDDAAEAVWARITAHMTAPEDSGIRHTLCIAYDDEVFTVSGVIKDGFAPAHQRELIMDSCGTLAFDHSEELLRAFLFTGCDKLLTDI